MKEIIQLHQSGRLDEAATAYRDLLSREPGNVDALRLYGVLQRQRGDLADAARLLDTARTVDPGRGDVLLELAGIRFIEGDLDQARQLAQAALKQDPNLAGGHTLLGQLALMSGQFADAESHYRTALRADEHDTNALTGIGHSFLERNDATNALRYLMRAAELNPGEGIIQFALGRAFRMQNNLAFAEQTLRNALRLRPELHAARLHLGQLLTEQGRADEAEAQYAVLGDAPAWRRAGLAGLGDSARMQGRFAEAIERYRESLALDPEQPMVLQALAWTCAQQGDFDTALALYTDHLATHPGDRLILAAMAEMHLNLGRLETAQELWTELLTRYPDDGLAATRLALLCERNGEFDDAMSFVERAEMVVPKDPELAFVRVRKALREGDDATAVALLEAIREWNLNDGQQRIAAHYRGFTHDRVGETEAAVAYWMDSQRNLPTMIHAQDPLPPEIEIALGAAPGTVDAGASKPVFLIGLPGSEVERIAALLLDQPGLRVMRDRAMAPLRADDFGQPDFSAYASLTAEDAAARRARYAAEKERFGDAQGAQDVDWLLRWDGRFAPLLRQAFPDATVIVVERDPRDLLLTWLSFGWMPGFPVSEPAVGADWLARARLHLDTLELSGVNVVRVNADAVLDDPAGAGVALARAVGLEALEPGRPQFGLGGLQLGLPAGRWMAYAETLGEPFSYLA